MTDAAPVEIETDATLAVVECIHCGSQSNVLGDCRCAASQPA